MEKDEIKHLGDLVKVELKEPEKYIQQVEQILNYFERLDKVEFDSEESLRKEISFDNLREDKYEPFLTDGKLLIEKLKKDQNNFIRAPKMI
ncbi:MAG: Asp-tRNA(Asn)/Glu-tRNA(Gln) amidotransferase subunit GatC [Nitrosotalea sp.]